MRAVLEAKGYVGEDGNLTTGVEPFNIFARLGSGVQSQEGMERENAYLSDEARGKFLIACNLPRNAAKWRSDDPAWIGNASMAKLHLFLTLKGDLDWSHFNVLALALNGKVEELQRAIDLLEEMRLAALTFAAAAPEWDPEHLGLFVHAFPHNSVQSLHVHMVDLRCTGPSFDALNYKNLPVTEVIKALRREMAA